MLDQYEISESVRPRKLYKMLLLESGNFKIFESEFNIHNYYYYYYVSSSHRLLIFSNLSVHKIIILALRRLCTMIFYSRI